MKALFAAMVIFVSSMSLRAQEPITLSGGSIYLAGWPGANDNQPEFNLWPNNQSWSPFSILVWDFLSLFDLTSTFQPTLQFIEPNIPLPPPELIPPVISQPPPIVIQPIEPIILQYQPPPVQIIDQEPPGAVFTIGVIDTTSILFPPLNLAPVGPVLTFGAGVEPVPEPSTCALGGFGLGLAAMIQLRRRRSRTLAEIQAGKIDVNR